MHQRPTRLVTVVLGRRRFEHGDAVEPERRVQQHHHLVHRVVVAHEAAATRASAWASARARAAAAPRRVAWLTTVLTSAATATNVAKARGSRPSR